MLPKAPPFGIFGSLLEMADSSALHAVIFRVGTLLCAAPAGIVREILPALPATRIPGVADSVSGLVNVRGSLLTVLDGFRLLGQQRNNEEGALLVLAVRGRTFGLAVGEVRDFVELTPGSVADQARLPGVDPGVVSAVARRDDEHFILLNLDALVGPVFGS